MSMFLTIGLLVVSILTTPPFWRIRIRSIATDYAIPGDLGFVRVIGAVIQLGRVETETTTSAAEGFNRAAPVCPTAGSPPSL